jgi:hypothetical protein
VASTGLASAPQQAPTAATGTVDAGQEGYRLTEHIKRYYSSARA